MSRAAQKEQTHQRIVDTAARCFREVGLSGAGVQRIMRDAGLTHGGFYGHFDSKTALIAEAFAIAAEEGREQWLGPLQGLSEEDALACLLRTYLSRSHRNAREHGCPLPAISSEISRESAPVRQAYETELRKSLEHIERALGDTEHASAKERAIGVLALCVGGLLLARAVHDPEMSDDILRACRRFAGVAPREED